MLDQSEQSNRGQGVPSTSTSIELDNNSRNGKKEQEKQDNEEDVLKTFLTEVSDARRIGECERILTCFKLNPYDILRIDKQNEASASEVRRAFRQVSLLVHPDKCPHKHAKEAFELVNKAYKDLQDPESDLKKDLDATLRHAKEELRKERKKLVKNDNAYLAAASLEGGQDVLEKEYECSKGFQDQWRKKAQELITQLEWRRRQLNKRIKNEEKRLDEEDKTRTIKTKNNIIQKKKWEKNTEKRVSSWRDFMTQPNRNNKKGKMIKKRKPII